MSYLCLIHRVQVARSAEEAKQLWLRAFCHGQDASVQKNWRVAETLFGCAFDIAKIRMHDVSRGQSSAFDGAQLVLSAQYFAQALGQLSRFAQADSALQFVHHHLMAKLAHENSTENKSSNLRQYLQRIEATGLKIAEERTVRTEHFVQGSVASNS